MVYVRLAVKFIFQLLVALKYTLHYVILKTLKILKIQFFGLNGQILAHNTEVVTEYIQLENLCFRHLVLNWWVITCIYSSANSFPSPPLSSF